MSAIQIKSAQILRLAAFAQDDRIEIAKANKSLPGSRLHHIFDSHPHPYRMRLQIKGLSHGLKKCPPDTFLPRFARPPFRVPPSVLKNADTHLGIRIFWYTGRDSNPQPSEPESDALSIEPPVRLLHSLDIIAGFSPFVKRRYKKFFPHGTISMPKMVVFCRFV